MGRRLAVRVCAWSLRHGVPEDDLYSGLRRAYRHRSAGWCSLVIADARERNRARLMKRINA